MSAYRPYGAHRAYTPIRRHAVLLHQNVDFSSGVA
jgi:hypothetical protein